jgi:predicted DsbA family dithiol-disulfide isomerase
VLDTSPDAAIVTLDFWADLSCPWCYVGSRRLALAVAHEPAGTVVTRWRAFQLHPGLPADADEPANADTADTDTADTADTADGERASAAGPDHAAAARARLREAGREVGIVFADPLLTSPADTSLAQRTVLLYDGETRQRAVCAALYAAHFERAQDIASLDVVASVAAQAAGDSPDEVRGRLLAGEGETELAADLLEARLLGVSAVPTYVVGRSVAVQGAQQVEILRALIAEGRRGGG